MLLALFGAVAAFDEAMYKDPEYADTWRYTDDPRYVDSSDLDEWVKSAPKDYVAMQTSETRRHHHHPHSHAQVAHKDWNNDDLRGMGLTKDYKEAAPEGYKESIKYEGGDDIVNTKEDRTAFREGMREAAAELADKSTHDKWTYPNLRPEVQENEEEVTFGNSLLGKAAALDKKEGIDHDHSIVMGGKVGAEANKEAFQKLDNIKNALKPKP